jgi:hypothetical protein
VSGVAVVVSTLEGEPDVHHPCALYREVVSSGQHMFKLVSWLRSIGRQAETVRSGKSVNEVHRRSLVRDRVIEILGDFPEIVQYAGTLRTDSERIAVCRHFMICSVISNFISQLSKADVSPQICEYSAQKP